MEKGSAYRVSAAYVLTHAGRELRQCCSITFYELSMSSWQGAHTSAALKATNYWHAREASVKVAAYQSPQCHS